MKEIIEFRIFKEHYHLLSKPNNAVFNGMAYVIYVERTDSVFEEIELLTRLVRKNPHDCFFGYSNIKRKYSKQELETATLLHMKIKTTFEPAGEECGTMYNETEACELCGANRKQAGSLKLKKGSVPNKDIARTIAGEVVVSERLATAFKQRRLKGAFLDAVSFDKGTSNYYQLTASSELGLTGATIAGVNLFDFSEGSDATDFTVSGGHAVRLEKEIYKCPKGHTIGLNILSELYVFDAPSIAENDFFASRQKIGVKRGLLRPEPLYLCSPAFRKMVEEEKLRGFDFEIARIQ